MVHIQVGDAADMPYDDDSFDVAISLFVMCNLSPESFVKHFQELNRVLVLGGKAILLAYLASTNQLVILWTMHQS